MFLGDIIWGGFFQLLSSYIQGAKYLEVVMFCINRQGEESLAIDNVLSTHITVSSSVSPCYPEYYNHVSPLIWPKLPSGKFN